MAENKKGAIIVAILVIALFLFLIYNTPEGSLARGHCGETHEASQVCFCFGNETRVETDVGFDCEEATENG